MDYSKLFESHFPGIFDTSTGGSLKFYPGDAPGGKLPAMLILPGGAYQCHADHEAERVAEAWHDRGYATFVLRYSLRPDRWPCQLNQACAAIAFIRTMAEEFAIDPNKVFVIGFSAGSHLASCTATCFEDAAQNLGIKPKLCRPNGAILCYLASVPDAEVITEMLEDLSPDDMNAVLPIEHVTPESAPVFLWHTAEDQICPVENAILFAEAYRKNRLKFELHIYAYGYHGLSLCTPDIIGDQPNIDPRVATWFDLSDGWLKELSLSN